jgi:hypothetical protein
LTVTLWVVVDCSVFMVHMLLHWFPEVFLFLFLFLFIFLFFFNLDSDFVGGSRLQ